MAILFLDSSAVVKRYVTEQGSEWVKTIVDPAVGNELQLSVLSGVEVISAIIRRRRVGSLAVAAAFAAIDEFLDDWQFLYSHVAVDERLTDRAMKLAEAHELLVYDATQLAAAKTLDERYRVLGLSMTLVSADDELNAAAATEGLQVENPNRHG